MDIKIFPGRASGSVFAPPSKSYSIRAAAIACMGESPCFLKNYSDCDDAITALRICEGFGAYVEKARGGVLLKPAFRLKAKEIDCGQSGLCARLFPIVALNFDKTCRFLLKGSLAKRPMGPVIEAASALGAKCIAKGAALETRGPARNNSITVAGAPTSQHITGLLIALPRCAADSEINLINPVSVPYIEMTINTLNKFGIKIDAAGNRYLIKGGQKPVLKEFDIEGDWSAAAIFLTAAAIAGNAQVKGLNMASLQADKKILNILESAGAKIKINGGSVSVKSAELNSFEADIRNSPDLAPALTALAFNCKGRSAIKGCGNLSGKESDRIAALTKEFSSLGGNISYYNGALIIENSRLSGGEVNSHNDHRIAMALATAALNASGPVCIKNAECVSKSYARFFEDFESLTKKDVL